MDSGIGEGKVGVGSKWESVACSPKPTDPQGNLWAAATVEPPSTCSFCSQYCSFYCRALFCAMEYSCGQFRTSVKPVFPCSLLPAPSLFAGGWGRDDGDRVGAGGNAQPRLGCYIRSVSATHQKHSASWAAMKNVHCSQTMYMFNDMLWPGELICGLEV